MITIQDIGNIGQFGNQMFQYAMLLGVSKKTGYDFGVPYQNQSDNRYNHYCLPDIFPNLTAKDSSGIKPGRRYREAHNAFFFPEVWKQPDGTDYVGWFQSERYFEHCRDQVLQEFTPYPEAEEEAAHFLECLRDKVRQPICFVHVRRTDALTNRRWEQTSLSYYRKAMPLFPDCHFLTLSDDIPWCKANLTWINMSYSPFENKFDDFCLMRLCDHAIITNSTFSWWGAYMIKNPDSKIVAPQSWHKFPLRSLRRLPPRLWSAVPKKRNRSNINCDSWITIDNREPTGN